MKRLCHVPPSFVRLFLAALLTVSFFVAPPARAYSVLSHEEVVDMAWKDTLIPMLQARFPGITPGQLREAHAYAYGGSVIQDIGYYPFGSHYFSDLLHYVRPNDFVDALIRDSVTPDDYAFALGALAHYCGDIIGHPAVNQVTADENPKLRREYGPVVTYAENPTAHIRTEFGFDVVEVAQGHYSQQNYHDFIGFQVAKPLLERAFLETYGMPMGDIIRHEDLAIGTYRRAVSSIIPRMTNIAFVSYKDQIQAAQPGVERTKFIYRLRKTEYERDFGTGYTHVSFGGRVVAFLVRLTPKVGPFKALKFSIPTPKEQVVYLKSVNSTVDRYKLYLGKIHAAPAPLSPPEPSLVIPPSTPTLAELDLDTGRPSTAGEYKLADQTYAHLLDDLVKSGSASIQALKTRPSQPFASAPASALTAPRAPKAATPAINPAIAADIERFFAHVARRTGPAPTPREAKKEAALTVKIKADLVTLNTIESAAPPQL